RGLWKTMITQRYGGPITPRAVLQTDGKLVVAADRFDPPDMSDWTTAVTHLWRLDANGQWDRIYGFSGVVLANRELHEVTVESDGISQGYYYRNSDRMDVRVLPNGALDTTYGKAAAPAYAVAAGDVN